MLIGFAVTTFNAFAQAPILVEVVYPELLEQSQTLELTGSVEARHHAQLATLVSGRVEELNVEVGDVVTLGQRLLTLDNQLAQLELSGAAASAKAAELNLKEAQRLYDEVQRLSAQKVVAKTLIAERAALLSKAEADLEHVKANHSLQKERLNRHVLKAPFAGVVAERNVDVGEWVNPQTAVMTLVAQNDLRLTIEIPQHHFASLQNNEEVQVKVIVDARNDSPIMATLSRLVPVSNTQTRTFLAQIDLPADRKDLIPGMSATAELTFPNSKQTGILLPKSAIKQHPDGKSSVFIVENNRAKRLVTTFKTMPNNQVALYGLSVKHAYITKGVEVLRDGTAVSVNVVKGKKR